MGSTANVDEVIDKARRHVRRKQFDKAIALFTAAVEADDRRLEAHEGLATAYFLSGDYEQSISHFKRMTHLDTRNGKALINLGAVYNRTGEYSKAIDVLRRGIQKEKSFSEAYYNLGMAYRGLGQSAMAVSAYKDAVRLSPEMAAAHQNLANIYVDMGNNQQAIIHYKYALEIKPEFDRAQRGLAKAENAIKQARKSISPFGRLVDASKLAVKGTPGGGKILTATERLQDRQAVFSIAAEIESGSNHWLAILDDEFESSLAALNRAVMQVNEAPAALTKASEEFQDVLSACIEIRTKLKQKLLELRAHEELMNTPRL